MPKTTRETQRSSAPTSPPLLRSATHVAFDSATTDRLLRIGATNVVRAADCLIIGPSRRDVLEHARAREAWWSSTEKWDDLYSPAVRWAPPVVLWVSESIHERVNLWRTCSWLHHLGIAHRDVLVLEFTLPPSEDPHFLFECTASVAHHPDNLLLERLETAHPWPRPRYDRAVSLWDRYVDENPLNFVESCIRGVEGFPELAPLWAFLSSFFPRKTSAGALRLSRFDELLLNVLSTAWATPLSMYVHISQAGEALWQLLSCTGDLFLPDRLKQWADHDASLSVERATGPKPTNEPMTSSVYRITERGMRLREEGLAQLADAPSLPMAGTEAYAPGAPWVVLDDGQLARL